jgi:DNA gyrase subunit A
MKLADTRGTLVGGLVVVDTDEVLAIKASGQVTRSNASDVPAKGRDTMGVIFVSVADGDEVVAIARNADREDEAVVDSALGGEAAPDEPEDASREDKV